MKTDVYRLTPGHNVIDALRMLVDKGISGAPVIDDRGQVTGFISDGDIMRYFANQTPVFKSVWSFAVERDNDHFNDKLGALATTPVSEVCTTPAVCVDAALSLGEVTRILGHHHLKKAPVLHEGTMVGIINRSNITRYALNQYLE
jgi:DHA2 family lincomycin resistance protein-like MFS transporter